MSVGTRFGVMLGLVLATAVLCLRYDYRPQLLGEASPLLVAVAPALTWLAIELAGWLRYRVRWLGRGLLLVAVIATGGWWLWLYGLFASGQVKAHMRFGVPSVLAGAYLIALLLGAWRSGKPASAGEARPAKHAELVSQ